MISRTTKVKLYKTLIVPVLIYGAEYWTLTDSDERMLDMFERKVLRPILESVCVNGKWRTRQYFIYGIGCRSKIVLALRDNRHNISIV